MSEHKLSHTIPTAVSRRRSAVSQVMSALQEYVEKPTPLWSLREEECTVPYTMRVATGEVQRRRARSLTQEVYRDAGLAGAPSLQEAEPRSDDKQTFTLLAEDETGRAAATVSLVFDGALGLPCDAICESELRALRGRGRHCVEVTRLAIREEHKANKLLLVRLFNFIYLYARRIRRFDDFVIEVHPRHVKFYRVLLGFEIIGECRPCPRVNGSPAVLLRLDLAYSDVEIARVAGRPGPHTRSLYPLFYAGVEEEKAVEFLRRQDRSAKSAATLLLNDSREQII